MLTKTDLKSIDILLDRKFDVKLKPIEKKLTNLENITSRTEKDVRKIRKNLKETSNFLDKENIKTVKRVRIIEEHLNLPEPAII